MNYYKNKKHSGGFYQLRGHIEDDKEHYLQRIKPFFKNLYGLDISLREMPSTRVFGFQIWNNELIKFNQGLGLELGPKLNVKIPDSFLIDDKLKIAIIRGIFDTDGCLYLQKKYGRLYPRIEIRSISFPLINQLREIYNELGLRATAYQDKLRLYGNKKISYIVTIRGIEMLHKFMNMISPQNPKHIKKYEYFKQSFK